MTEQLTALRTEFVCRVDIELEKDAPIVLGRSPWRNRRVSYIAGGTIEGDRLKGVVLPGGGDWSESAVGADGAMLILVDVRSVWRTNDGALIHVTYAGRLIVPAPVVEDFREPARIDHVDPTSYYFRITPVFETSDQRYEWLNRVVAVGQGRRTRRGVIYDIYLVR